jgi:hypothetical protein
MHPIIILRYISFGIAVLALITILIYNKYFYKRGLPLRSKEYKQQLSFGKFLRGTLQVSFIIWILTFIVKFFIDLDPNNVHVVFVI